MNSLLYTIFGILCLLTSPATEEQVQSKIGTSISEESNGKDLNKSAASLSFMPPPDDCSETFIKTFGNAWLDERASVILADGNGGFYIGGSREDSVLLVKMDETGTLLWQRSFLFTDNGDNTLFDLKLDSDNNLIACGFGDNGANDRTGFAFRYNPDANNMIWVQNHEHPTLNVANYDIQEANAGGDFLITGQTHNNAAPGLGCDGYIFGLDRNTGVMTALNEHYNLGSCETFGTAQIYNNELFTGGRYNFAGGGSNKMRAAMSCFDLNGNEIWSRLYLVDLVANARLYTTDLLIENDSIIQTHIGDKDGTSTSNAEAFLSKANLEGQLHWAKEYTLAAGGNITFQEIISLSDGYAILGLNKSDDNLFILKTDKDGNPIWAKAYGAGIEILSSESGVEMIYTNEHFYIAGYSEDFGAGDDDMVVIKVNKDGLVNNNCAFIQDLNINVNDVLNPYDGLQPLTAYPSPVTGTNPIITPAITDLAFFDACYAGCIEVCDNGIDDDGDGLIDCYDPDCCDFEGCSVFYYNDCTYDCTFDYNAPEILLQIEWESSGAQDWCSYNTPITGDIDGDGIPEIIGKPCTGDSIPASAPYPNLLIVDGLTGNIEAMINTPAFYYLADGPAIADVDHNGFAEIFIMASDHSDNANYTGGGPIITGNVERKVLCYEFNGSTYEEKWVSDQQAGYTDIQQAMSVSIADFNEDGIPELYLGTQVFNSLTGQLIVEGGINEHHGVKPVGDDASLAQALTVAADVLPDDFCLNCSGLELVAGGMVFSVSINPSTPSSSMMNVEMILPGSNDPNLNKDGFTSIADIDKDGDLDAVITTTNNNFGVVYAWDLQTTSLLYSEYLTPSTNIGRISQANVADFDGDGLLEIGVCSKSHYQVIKPSGNPIGGSLTTLWEIDTDDFSGSTGSCVFDFNNDGAAEVVYRGETEIQILDGSNGTSLSSLPCASGTRVEYPVVVDVDLDGETEILCSCENTLVAYGSAFSPWLDARSVWNQHNYFNTNINDDLTVPPVQQLHHIVGDSVQLNNFLTMYSSQEYLVPDAVLTFDSLICEPNSIYVTVVRRICNEGDNVLPANIPVSTYSEDPTTSATATLVSTFMTNFELEPGECEVVTSQMLATSVTSHFTVINDDGSIPPPFSLELDLPISGLAECDYSNNMDNVSDNMILPTLNLGLDQEICDGAVITLDAGDEFESYLWSTTSTGQSIMVTEPGTYIVTAFVGCLAKTDTVFVTLDPASSLSIGADQSICTGESANISVANDVFDQYQWSPSATLNCDDCPNVIATPELNTQYIVIGTTNEGCSSTDTINISVGFELDNMSINLCEGETTIVFGQIVSGNGIYTDTIFNDMGCDTILTVTTIESDPFSVDIIGTGTCPGENSGTATATVIGGVAPLEYNWNPPAENSPTPSGLAVGQYNLTITDAIGCTAENTVFVDMISEEINIDFTTEAATCFDSEDGVLLIDSSALGLSFSLDEVFYSPQLVFDQLAVGTQTLFIRDDFGCVHTQEFEIPSPPAIIVSLPEDTTLVLGQSLTIRSFTNFLDSPLYNWTPMDFLDCFNCPDVLSTPFETTEYILTVTDTLGCTGIDTILISVRKERNVYIPNAFSPNFDGINDIIYIYSDIGVEEVMDFQIFDRWGEPVFSAQNFETNNPDYGWDGIFKGQVMNSGVFVYFAKIRFVDGEELLYSGDISILK